MVLEPSEWPAYSEAAATSAAEIVLHGSVFDYRGDGPVRRLEQAFEAYHDGRLSLSFNSGTSALFAALVGLGVSPGDEVIVPNWTFLASVSPILWLGADIVFCDSAPDDPNVTASALRKAITWRTRVIVVTHLFGRPVDMERIAELTEEFDVPIIADCSHAHASTVEGRPVGVFGDAAFYSLGARKMVSGGHGGMLLTSSESLLDTALLLGHFKPRARRDVRNRDLLAAAEFGLGGNLRMTPISATLAMDHFGRLGAIADAKIANVAKLQEALDGQLVPLTDPPGRANRTYFDVVFQLPSGVPATARDRVVKAITDAGVAARAPATGPINRVLRKIVATRNATEVPLWDRLYHLALSAPPDAQVPHSTGLYDRLISFPSSMLHRTDLTYAHDIASRLRSVNWRRAFGDGSL